MPDQIHLILGQQPPVSVLDKPSMLPTPEGPQYIQVTMILFYPPGIYEIIGEPIKVEI